MDTLRPVTSEKRLRSPMILLWILEFCVAFDFGHHNDLINNAMSLKGYSTQCVAVAQERAWFVEYFANYANFNTTTQLAQALHMVGLTGTDSVDIAFSVMASSTRDILLQIAKTNATAEYCALLGLTLHSVQNFYAHSNWVDGNARRDCTCFNSATFFANGTASRSASASGTTTPTQTTLGSYCAGSNKESYARLGFEEAYAFALAGSLSWIDAFEAMSALSNGSAYPALALQPLTFRDDTIAPSVTSDVYYAYRITLWSSGDSSPTFAPDGRWKGPHSGNVFAFEVISNKYEQLQASLYYFARFLTDTTKWLPIASALQSPPATPLAITFPALPASSNVVNVEALQAIVVRTYNVNSLGGSNVAAPSNFYAELSFSGPNFATLFARESVIYDVANNNPSWSTIFVLPTSVSSVNLTYAIKDASGLVLATDTPVRINDMASYVTLQISLPDGAITGDLSGDANTNITTKGVPDSSVTGLAASVTLSIRIVSYSSACTGASVPDCLTINQSAVHQFGVSSDASTLSISLTVLLLLLISYV